MQLGIHVNNYTWPGAPSTIAPTLASIAHRAEEAGYYSLSVMDHFFQIPNNGPSTAEMLEAYTTLGFLAGQTQRLRLGTIVTSVTWRNPGTLVKEATTLDVLSGGRSFFGVGGGNFEEEHVAFGQPFPEPRERLGRLEEVLQIALRMWAGDEQPYTGKYYQLPHPILSPKQIQQPRPLILIGGGGEQKTLRLVAKYADACNLSDAAGLDELKRKLDVLKEHCAKVGRPFEQITVTVNTRFTVSRDGANGSTTPAALVERFAKLREVGVGWIIHSMPNVSQPDSFDLLGSQVVPEVSKL